VFPAPRGEYLNQDYLRKLVNKALTKVGIQAADARTGRPRKPFHSLRATWARQQLEKGRNPQWVENQLGHSTLELTIHVYGAWGEEAMRAEARKADPEPEPVVA
jgi:integrase